jgi:hypothetical protein
MSISLYSFDENQKKTTYKMKHLSQDKLEVHHSHGKYLAIAFESAINCMLDEVDSLLGCQTADDSDNRDISLL